MKLCAETSTQIIVFFFLLNLSSYISGASDNLAFCAIMAEALTKLSRSKTKLKRNIIFLFNGAEENGLQVTKLYIFIKEK